ncbi:Dna2-domain-containing protein [Dendrothele bispora CBS 962.96]|uniref:DNA replication ATP-dependent helicase/nuclease DNA2 n=1 Tax=Dendrothele bispora (strain CBS 962.96) TaxID=1314807 RepID=A0A4S8KM16_DENBC|nr:Dna2-domain-containing protein [Dendrothele bispora CBS 962.96]
MGPFRHSAQEEADFMQDLLSGLDDSFRNTVPSPKPSPVKSKCNASPARKAPYHVTPVKKRDSGKCLPSPSQVFTAEDVDVAALLEGAEDWNWDVELSPKKETKKPDHVRETCTRCVVCAVSEGDTDGRFSKVRIAIDFLLLLEATGEYRSVSLQDDWVFTDVRVGDIINVLGEFTVRSQSSSTSPLSITISSKHNFLILHPDLLLTATSLSTASQCRRRPLLSSMIRSSTNVSPALVWGNLLHTVMQNCLSSGRWDERWVDEQIEEVVRDSLLDLVKINVNVETAIAEVKARAKGVHTFFERYLADEPKSEAVLTNTRAGRNQTSLLAISELLDVEEDIWSPTYGLKGKLDATVLTTISELAALSASPVLTHGPKPLEIKTGRALAGMEHRAQTMLYTLLAQERYGIDVSSGLLYYTQSEEVVQVPASRNELRGLILGRNDMAAYLMKRQRKGSVEPFLPATIDDERICKKCYSLDSCMLYRKAVENVEDHYSPIADAYSLKTSHLTPSQSAFFKEWEHLLSLEEQDIGRFRKELWTMGAAERETNGRCFSDMILDTSFNATPIKGLDLRDRIHSFTYRFTRAPRTATSSSFLNGSLDVNDPITVSVEPHFLGLARGFITQLTPTEVVVGVDHDLSLDRIRKRMDAFDSPSSSFNVPILFRIDREELHSGMGRIRDNLARLFYASGDTRRLELVVDLKSPSFNDDVPSLSLSQDVTCHSEHLNNNQKQAMDKVLRADDYALILGMPGTGKTTVIAAIIKTLVTMGKTVLLTSYTHSAVDTILLKLKDVDFSILRLGNTDKVHAQVREFTLANKRKPTTVEQLEHQLMTPPVVATTSARKGGLDVSLFRRLSDAHPHAVVDLVYQYRMNADIMLLSNTLIYSDRLRCGNTTVAEQSLVLKDRQFLDELVCRGSACELSDECEECWLKRLMSERCKAVFVDTDLVPAKDSRVGDLVQNEGEATLVCQITETLLRSGVTPDQIGIISPYRQQIKLLTQKLETRREGLEILTADKSQGRDKDCIIISMVRSNDDGHVGDLVKDWRRMNVSFTRARSKLIIIGSRKTLQSVQLLEEFFDLMQGRGWILKLPLRADIIHEGAFPKASGSPKRKYGLDDGVLTKAVGHGKENGEDVNEVKPSKRLKSGSGFQKISEDVLMKGRPILRDLMNDVKGSEI